jgi:predicted dehydrogenase
MIVKLANSGFLTCTAYCDPSADKFPEQRDKLLALGAKGYSDYMEMLKQHEMDLVVIATPIPLHKRMSIHAMEHGVPVLLEKPPAVRIEDLDEMIAVQRRTGVVAGVQFQNTSGQGFRAMLQMIAAGRIGRVESIASEGIWMRAQSYYERTGWAGKIMYNGDYVLDGTLCNPFAHLLNNTLVAAGGGDARQSEPVSVQAELYKGHDIESEDTASVRIVTKNGVRVHVHTTLCKEDGGAPSIRVNGTEGKLVWNYDNKLEVSLHDGTLESFDYGREDLLRNMYLNMLAVLNGKEGAKLNSSLEDTRSYMLALNGAFTSSGGTYAIPKEALDIWQEGGTEYTRIKQIEELFKQAGEEGKLLSEIGVSWAVSTKPVNMTNYSKLLLS